MHLPLARFLMIDLFENGWQAANFMKFFHRLGPVKGFVMGVRHTPKQHGVEQSLRVCGRMCIPLLRSPRAWPLFVCWEDGRPPASL